MKPFIDTFGISSKNKNMETTSGLLKLKDELESQINFIQLKKRRVGITLPLELYEQENKLIFELEDVIIKLKNLSK